MTWEGAIALIGLVLGSNWVGTLLLEIYRQKKKKKTPQEKMLLALCRDRILSLAKKYIELGGIPEDEYDNYKLLLESYLAGGGNSTVAKIGGSADSLPIIGGSNGK